MVKVRNQSLFFLLLVGACLTAPAVARQQTEWLAQAPPDTSAPAEPTEPEAAAEDESTAEPDAAGEAPASLPVEVPPVAPGSESAPEPEGIPVEPSPAGATPPELTPPFRLPPDGLPADTTLNIQGSASMQVITRTLQQRFEAEFPNASVTITEQSTDQALQNLLAGDTELAAIGRPLSDAEKGEQGLMEVTVSREKIAMIVGANNPFGGDLDSEDFVRIFRGEINNWSQLGGPDLPIRFIDRPADSDTRRALGDYDLFAGDLTTGPDTVTVENDSTSDVVAELGEDGIGYAIASQVLDQENVRVLPMHSTLPDDPRYPYSQPRNYVYRGTDSLTPGAEAFLAFATNTPAGQEAVVQAKAAEAADVAVADLPDRVMAIRPDGQGYVTGDRSGNLTFWNADGTLADKVLAAHVGPVTALAFSPSGERLYSGGADGTIQFWDSSNERIGDRINNAGNVPVTSLAVQEDLSFVSASADGTIQRWNSEGVAVDEVITAHTDTVRDMALTPDGQTLVTASEDGTVCQWDIAAGAAKGEPLAGHQGAVRALAMKPDGSGFFSGGADGTVRQWTREGEAVGTPTEVAGPVSAIAINPDGSSLAVGDNTGSLQLLAGDGTPTGEAISDIEDPIEDLAFTPNGEQLIVAAGEEPQIRSASGQLIPPEASEEATQGDDAATSVDLPAPLLDLWERFQRLPPAMQLLLLPIVLILGTVAWWLLRGLQPEEETESTEVTEQLPDDTFDDFSDTDSPFSFDSDFDAGVENKPISGITSEEAAASLDPNLSKARQALADGIDFAASGRHPNALDSFTKAIEAADLERLKAEAAGISLVGATAILAEALARRGLALGNLGRPDDAFKSFDRALEMKPDGIVAWIGKGNLMAQTERWDEALFCFDKAIELNPDSRAAWQGKGRALQQMGRDADAQACFTKAQTLSSSDDDAALELNDRFANVGGIGGVNALRPPAVPAIDREPASPPALTNEMDGDNFVDMDTDVPPELEDAIATLPVEPDEPAIDADGQAAAAASFEGTELDMMDDFNGAAVPEDILAAVEDLPAEPDLPQPSLAPVGVTSVTEVRTSADPALSDTKDIVNVDYSADDRFGYGALADDIPPDIMEALQNIPDNVADSAEPSPNVESRRPVPPPPPSNPRLKKPS